MFHVYILLSLKDGKFYIGMSANLKRGIFEHKREYVKFVKNNNQSLIKYGENLFH